MRRLALLGLVLFGATPAGAQVRVIVDGRAQDVPAGIVRTISYEPGGRQRVRDEPFGGETAPGAATITTTETTDEDEDGRVVRRQVTMRIEPVAMAALAMRPATPAFRTAAYAPRPAPRLETDLAGFAEPGETGPTLRIRRDPATGHFVATVRINGVAVRAIVDTGAQTTVLSAGDARTTGADRAVVRETPMAGIGGLTMLRVARIDALEVGGQALGALDACIGEAGIPYTLLGQSEIARLGRIVIEDGVMTITPRGAMQMAAR